MFFKLPIAFICLLLISPIHSANVDSYAAVEFTDNKGLVLKMLSQSTDFSYGDDKYQEVFKRMLSSPCELSQQGIDDLRPIFNEMLLSNKLLIELLPTRNLDAYIEKGKKDHAAIVQSHQKNPLFFLQECIQCKLQRNENKDQCPKQKFLDVMLKNLPEKSEPLTVVFYASGDCFWEIEVIANLLAKGHNIAKIIFIEPIFHRNIEDIILKKSSIINLDVILKSDTRNRKGYYLLMEVLYFLSHHNSDISLIIYGDSEDYLKDATVNHQLQAQLLFALDYEDVANPNLLLDEQLDELFNYSLRTNGFFYKIHSENGYVVRLKE